MDSDERTWLRNPQTGGYFHCPNGAVDHWKALGWQPVDEPPAELNPAVAELVAWREARAAEQDSSSADTETPPAPTKPRRGAPTDTTKE
jgi:hypothetical protein